MSESDGSSHDIHEQHAKRNQKLKTGSTISSNQSASEHIKQLAKKIIIFLESKEPINIVCVDNTNYQVSSESHNMIIIITMVEWVASLLQR